MSFAHYITSCEDWRKFRWGSSPQVIFKDIASVQCLQG